MSKNIKKYMYASMALAMVFGLTLALPALAETEGQNGNVNVEGRIMMAKPKMNRGLGLGRGGMMRPVVVGTVTIVSGNTVTVSGHQGFSTTTPAVTFTVDATNAKITKNNSAGTIASILVGDTVSIQGTITGTNVVAKNIRDGQVPMMGAGKGQEKQEGSENGQGGNMPSIITGNGQPVVGGTISVISGSSITITNKSNVTYTVDATNAKITQGQNIITVSGLKVGDPIIVQGTVSGTSIVASSIVDQSKPTSTTTGNSDEHKGFFGGIGSFFSHMFGF